MLLLSLLIPYLSISAITLVRVCYFRVHHRAHVLTTTTPSEDVKTHWIKFIFLMTIDLSVPLIYGLLCWLRLIKDGWILQWTALLKMAPDGLTLRMDRCWLSLTWLKTWKLQVSCCSTVYFVGQPVKSEEPFEQLDTQERGREVFSFVGPVWLTCCLLCFLNSAW